MLYNKMAQEERNEYKEFLFVIGSLSNLFTNIDGLFTHLMRNNPCWTKLDVYMEIALSGFGMRTQNFAENRHLYL